MKSVQFSVIVDGVQKKKDGTLSLKLGTQELSPAETAEIFEMGNKQIWCALAEVPMSDTDLQIPEVLGEFRTDKSPSQRLRDVLWIYWDQHLKGKEDWEIFYKRKIDGIVEHIKDKLE